jgi:hypothetical protein
MAALGAVRYTAQRAAGDRVADVRREAYAALVTAAHAAADFYDARPGMLPLEYDETVRVELNERTDNLLAAVHRAIAVVQIVGSPAAADHAVILANAAHGSVSSHLGRVFPSEAVSRPWIELVTGAGVVFFRLAIADFIRTARAELAPQKRRWWIVRWRQHDRTRLSASSASASPTADNPAKLS